MRTDFGAGPQQRSSGLVDLLDRVLDKGLVIAGDIKVSLAEVELLTIRIRLIVCSIDKAEQDQSLPSLEFVPWDQMDALYEAVVQSVEEAVLNVLVAGRTMLGRDSHRSPGFPVARLPQLLA